MTRLQWKRDRAGRYVAIASPFTYFIEKRGTNWHAGRVGEDSIAICPTAHATKQWVHHLANGQIKDTPEAANLERRRAEENARRAKRWEDRGDLPMWEVRAKKGDHEEILGIYPARTTGKARDFALADHAERLGLRWNRRTREWIEDGWVFPKRLVKEGS